jgi:hypothetical protein
VVRIKSKRLTRKAKVNMPPKRKAKELGDELPLDEPRRSSRRTSGIKVERPREPKPVPEAASKTKVNISKKSKGAKKTAEDEVQGKSDEGEKDATEEAVRSK